VVLQEDTGVFLSGVAKGLQEIYYGGTLAALALESFDFCIIGVNPPVDSSPDRLHR